jgi:hypothetical protein
MSEYFYVRHCHHSESVEGCESLKEAIEEAIMSINGDNCWPVEIRNGGDVLWKCGGASDTAETLMAFADANGVTDLIR